MEGDFMAERSEPNSGQLRLLVNYVLFGVFLVWLLVSYVLVGDAMTNTSWYMPVTFALAVVLAGGQLLALRRARKAPKDAEHLPGE
ncbi:hypothetical protein [Acrocarpospora corrugata]|uniref:hypothetical protein n=1 Tax=Acrocarpospora corrugata TaxID=35763 RepID=UPI0012D2D642|nr:hypothetical protein [Acrocarpospora corrugata]